MEGNTAVAQNNYDQSYQNYSQGQKNYRGKNFKKEGNYYKKNYNKPKPHQPYNNNNNNYQKEKVDPNTARMLIYRAEMYILLKYPFLLDLNTKNSSLACDDKSQFFVIKSFSEEDVHKAIKYNVWTSTKSGNQALNNAFKLTQENGGSVYLFFSCNGSGRFVGLARMKTEVNFEQFFPFWTQDNKWGGLFGIEWFFIKDVLFNQFNDIQIMMRDGQRKPVTNSRDTQEIPYEEGAKMFEIMKSYVNSNTILEHFEYYDIRQENYENNGVNKAI